MRSPVLLLREILDYHLRKNFELLQEHFDAENQLLGFRHISFETTGAVTNLKVPHLLPGVPRDLLRTRKSGAGSVTFNRHLFDTANIDVTTTGAVKVRLFVGTWRSDTSTVTDGAADTEVWT